LRYVKRLSLATYTFACWRPKALIPLAAAAVAEGRQELQLLTAAKKNYVTGTRCLARPASSPPGRATPPTLHCALSDIRDITLLILLY